MAETTQVTVTKTWTKLADGDCTVQSANASNYYQIAVSAEIPTTDAAIIMQLAEPTTFAYQTAIYCRLPSNGKDSAIINVIK